MALLNAPTGREAMRTFLKTVTDDIVDPSADLMTLMAAGFGRLQAAFEASNTFVVAEGGRYETIQSAVDAAVAAGGNSKVEIHPGTYAEVLTGLSGVTLKGVDRHKCIISGASGSHTLSIAGANVILEDLTITAVSTDHCVNSPTGVDPDGLIVRRCNLTSTSEQSKGVSIVGTGAWSQSASDVRIEHCYFECGRTAIGISRAHTNLRILNNDFFWQGAVGSTWIPINLGPGYGAIISGNHGWWEANPSGDPIDEGPYMIYIGGHGHQISHNDFYLSSIDGYGDGSGIIKMTGAVRKTAQAQYPPISIFGNKFHIKQFNEFQSTMLLYMVSTLTNELADVDLANNEWLFEQVRPWVGDWYGIYSDNLNTTVLPTIRVFPGGFGGLEPPTTEKRNGGTFVEVSLANTFLDLKTAKHKLAIFDSPALALNNSRKFFGGGTASLGYQFGRFARLSKISLASAYGNTGTPGTLTAQLYKATNAQLLKPAVTSIINQVGIVQASHSNEPLVVNNGETAWTTKQGANVVCTADTTQFRVGAKCVKLGVQAAAINDKAAYGDTPDSLVMANYDRVQFYLMSSITLLAQQIGLDFDESVDFTNDDGIGSERIQLPAIAANRMYHFDMPLGALIQSLTINTVGIFLMTDVGAFDLYLDDIRIYKAAVDYDEDDYMSLKIDNPNVGSTPSWSDIGVVIEYQYLA